MDLILWRNAEADENPYDMERRLTAKGRRQCERVAAWLDQRLPARFAVLAPAQILQAAGWPDSKSMVVVVGHQPDLGSVLAVLFSADGARWTIKKGGLWWLTNRVRGAEQQVVVRAVVSPDLI